MSGIRVDLDSSDLDLALGKLKEVEGSVIVRRAVNEIASDLRATTPRDTGELIGSIRQEVSGNTGHVGYQSEYAPHVEYGHRQQPGRYVPKIGKRLKASYVDGQHFFQKEMSAARRVLRKRVRQVLKERGM